ncbi:MAG: acetyl-CoA C-acyltransferase [Gammaproteobacteria bacterium]|nr:acetyl-CoA C-acyltransferase [Gammaproteobacteria bacterium]
MSDPVVIVAAKRTPLGAFQGQFSSVSAPQLASAAIAAAVEQSDLKGTDINEAIFGCVLPAGVGQAPARQAVLGAGLPRSLPSTTVNKVCGSAMKATMLGFDQIRAGAADIVLTGGMESMTNAPYLLPKARGGYRLGHGQMLDHMFYDGLQNPYDNELMGVFAEKCAEKYSFSRAEQDAFAAESVRRAQRAVTGGEFKDEIAPVKVASKKGEQVIDQDETAMQCDIARIPTLKPAFKKDGTVTPANSSSISDGAAALILMRESEAQKRGVKPLARVLGHTSFAHEPEWFTTAPVSAIDKLQRKLEWSEKDVDLYEINEAFAVVTMAAMRDLKLPHDKVNVNGGACALGHPIGATGARIIVTLLYALKAHKLKRGIASLCIGGGEATALAVELT